MQPSLRESTAKLQAHWDRWVDLNARRHEPGFLGRVPYVLVLRYFISCAVIVRFWIHRSEYGSGELSRTLVPIFGMAAVSLVATYVLLKPWMRRSRMLQLAFVSVDIAIISEAYFLTGNPESDFFLFYYLPIFGAVEHLSKKSVVIVCATVALSMTIVVFSMQPMVPPPWTPTGLVVRVLVPRWVFFIAIVLTSAFVFRTLSISRAELWSLLDSLHSVSTEAAPKILALDEAVERILSEITEALKFEFATVSLVDEYRDCVETVRGRNVPPGWIRRAKHTLGGEDIQARIVQSGETKELMGWHDSFDRELYTRYEHWRYARVFSPIVSGSRVVGTIEAGCSIERKSEVITHDAIQRIEELGRTHGEQIDKARPHAILEVIARRAIELIGVDSATLHVYRQTAADSSSSQEAEWGELILAAGAGRADHRFVRTFLPSPSGRGKSAVRTREPQWLDDPQKFAREYPQHYDLGVRAFAVIPLFLGQSMQAVLGIHYWQTGKRFGARELNLAAMFAREMEVVIQNHLHFKNATDVGGRSWALHGLQNLMQSLTAPFHLPDVLKKIAKNALLFMDANNVVVYQYRSNEAAPFPPPVVEGHFLDRDAMRIELEADVRLTMLIDKGTSQFVSGMSQDTLPAECAELGMLSFIARENIRSCAVLILRLGSTKETVGIIFVNFRDHHEFTIEEKRVMSALAESAGLAIRTARLHKTDIDKQLEAMHAVHSAIAEKGPNLTQVLERLLERTLELTGAKYGVFMAFNAQQERLDPMARWPRAQSGIIEPQKLGDGVIGLAARSKRSILLEDVEDESKSVFIEGIGDVRLSEAYKRVNLDTRCELAVPLVDSDGILLGVLNIEHAKPGSLTEDHKALLEILAVPAIIGIRTVELYTSLERRIRHLTSLKLIAAYVLEKPYELDTVIQFFLTGVTAAEGLGFSRAVLFLVGSDGRLKGESAIGAISREEAAEIWQQLKQKGATSTLPFLNLLQESERFSNGSKETSYRSRRRLIQGISALSLAIDNNLGALSSCVRTGEVVRVSFGQDDPFRNIIGKFTEPNDLAHAFVCMPLIGRGKRCIGALVADNRFLWSERKIEDEEVAGLEAFARLLALSIENTRLRERMARAHTIGTRIGLTANTMSKLRASVDSLEQSSVAAEMREYLGELEERVNWAKHAFTQVQFFASRAQLQLRELDLRTLVEQVSREVPQGCHCILDLARDPLPILADSSVLVDAFREIVMNAHEAMMGKRDGSNILKMRTSMELSESGTPVYAQLEITDSGPGIPRQIREILFEPFVTEDKQNSTGMGLANARKFVEDHGGTIEAAENPGGGARFTIRLPLLPSRQAE